VSDGRAALIADPTRRHGTRQPFERFLFAMVANRTHDARSRPTASKPLQRLDAWREPAQVRGHGEPAHADDEECGKAMFTTVASTKA
jgi:hypothetical protein